MFDFASPYLIWPLTFIMVLIPIFWYLLHIIKEQNNKFDEQKKIIDSLNSKINNQSSAIDKLKSIINQQNNNLNKTIDDQKTEINNLNKTIDNQNSKFFSLNKTITLQETNINKQKENMKNLWISSLLQNNLNCQIITYSERKIKILENQYTKILNSYKILYYRKLSNIILNFLFTEYKKYFSKTGKIFCNDDKPKDKQIYFSIIGVKNKYKKINLVDKYLINLIIDFFNHIKDITSSVIHLSEKNYKTQIEILSIFIGKDIKDIDKIDDKYYINSQDLINILFDDTKQIKEEFIQKNGGVNEINNKDKGLNVNGKEMDGKEELQIKTNEDNKEKCKKDDISKNEEKNIISINNENKDVIFSNNHSQNLEIEKKDNKIIYNNMGNDKEYLTTQKKNNLNTKQISENIILESNINQNEDIQKINGKNQEEIIPVKIGKELEQSGANENENVTNNKHEGLNLKYIEGKSKDIKVNIQKDNVNQNNENLIQADMKNKISLNNDIITEKNIFKNENHLNYEENKKENENQNDKDKNIKINPVENINIIDEDIKNKKNDKDNNKILDNNIIKINKKNDNNIKIPDKNIDKKNETNNNIPLNCVSNIVNNIYSDINKIKDIKQNYNNTIPDKNTKENLYKFINNSINDKNDTNTLIHDENKNKNEINVYINKKMNDKQNDINNNNLYDNIGKNENNPSNGINNNNQKSNNLNVEENIKEKGGNINNKEEKENNIINNNINKENNNITNIEENFNKNEKKEIVLKRFDEILLKYGNNDDDKKNSNIINNYNGPYFYNIEELEKILAIKTEDDNYEVNKITIIKEIKRYVNLIFELKTSENEDLNIIDISYIFNSWLSTFDKGYKCKKEFKNIVKKEKYKNINLSQIKQALLKLIPSKKFEIFINDPSNIDK